MTQCMIMESWSCSPSVCPDSDEISGTFLLAIVNGALYRARHPRNETLAGDGEAAYRFRRPFSPSKTSRQPDAAKRS